VNECRPLPRCVSLPPCDLYAHHLFRAANQQTPATLALAGRRAAGAGAEAAAVPVPLLTIASSSSSPPSSSSSSSCCRRGWCALGWPCTQGLTLVPISAQLELALPLSAQLKLTLAPTQPKFTRGCGPKVLKLSSNVSDVFLKVLKLSSEVSECKPLPAPHASPAPAAERARRK